MSRARRVATTHRSRNVLPAVALGVAAISLSAIVASCGARSSEPQRPIASVSATASVHPSASATITLPPTPTAKSKPVATKAAAPRPTSSPSHAPTKQIIARPKAAPPLRLVYGALGINLPVAALGQPVGLFDPPFVKTSAYWIEHFGQPGVGADNTTYIIAHSGEVGGWPFNALSTSARVGDRIDVLTANGTVTYKVTGIASYSKQAMQDNTQTPVWDIDPNALKLISCKSGDVWQQNTVVTAMMQ